MNAEQNAKGKIQSIVRGCEIMKCFYGAAELGLMEIARAVGLNKSTAYGLVSTLTACGFLQQDSQTGKYSVGLEAFRVGQRFRPDVVKYIRPFLLAMAEEFQETVNFVVRDGADIIYIEKVESPLSMRISTFRGMRRPMYSNGAGKAIWAYLDPRESEEVMQMTRFERVTENTITGREAMLRELEEIRRRGYSIDREETEYGLYCLAVPILSRNGQPYGALSVSGPRVRITAEAEARIVKRLREEARIIASGFPV